MNGSASSDAATAAIDPGRFRQVLGQYPTGVCVVTATSPEAEQVAMVVGSFSSVSLDPPLVAFFPDRKSSSWARLRTCDSFCVNVLSADQEDLCRKLASKDPDKFSGVAHRRSGRGNPILEGAVAWIDCERHSVTDAGDHEMATGRVLDLDVGGGALPLLFFRGGYGRFTPATMVADQDQGIALAQLRNVDRARGEMDRLATGIGGVCIATVRVANELVIAASAGQPKQGGTATLVGQRLPFSPPAGAVFGAWLPMGERETWSMRSAQSGSSGPSLEAVRQRGFSVGLRADAQRTLSERLISASENRLHRADVEDLLSALLYDPEELTPELKRDIRLISAPVFGAAGEVEMALTLYDFPKPDAGTGIDGFVAAVVDAAEAVTARLGGRASQP